MKDKAIEELTPVEKEWARAMVENDAHHIAILREGYL